MFPSANLLAVSATCNKEIRRTVMKKLGLQKESTTLIIRSPDKSNIKYYVKKNWQLHRIVYAVVTRFPGIGGFSADIYLCYKCEAGVGFVQLFMLWKPNVG